MHLGIKASDGDLPHFDEPDGTDAGVVETSFRKLGPSVIVKDSRIGKSSDFWNRFKEDIKRAKDLGMFHTLYAFKGLRENLQTFQPLNQPQILMI